MLSCLVAIDDDHEHDGVVDDGGGGADDDGDGGADDVDVKRASSVSKTNS